MGEGRAWLGLGCGLAGCRFLLLSLLSLLSLAVIIQPLGRNPAGTPILAEMRLEPGRVMAEFGADGWGELIRDGKHTLGRFDDRLVDAAAEVVRDSWRPSPPPGWVTFVPSARQPGLMPDFAGRLAESLGLPCLGVVEHRRDAEPQKSMPDERRRYENVLGTFGVKPSAKLPSEPVLLLDDIVNSRWTLTLVGAELRRAGVAAVHPFALADSSGLGASITVLGAACPFA